MKEENSFFVQPTSENALCIVIVRPPYVESEINFNGMFYCAVLMINTIFLEMVGQL